MVELCVLEFLDEFFFLLFHSCEFFFPLQSSPLFLQDFFFESGADLFLAEFLRTEEWEYHFPLFAFDGFAFLLLDLFALARLLEELFLFELRFLLKRIGFLQSRQVGLGLVDVLLLHFAEGNARLDLRLLRLVDIGPLLRLFFLGFLSLRAGPTATSSRFL